MKKNIVLIRTIENVGTGILYPCHYDNAADNCNSFIVFTNRHVIYDLVSDGAPQDVKDSIILQIYDDNGGFVESSQIKHVLAHIPLCENEKQNDVAALLVDIDISVPITLQTRIYHGELKDRAILYMEGYPGIMLNDEISQKVQLEGMAKTIFPDNPHIGVYQIRDDYHWYNDYKDLRLMEGFSGSPVYIKDDNKTFLIGMNQSVADIDNGENPFKLVYYLKITHMLECLRRTGCILFQRLEEDKYLIEWIYGLENKIREYTRCPTFLLLGGSGAGKSSFAKDFALNGDKLCSTNDGQTTRTNVIYEYGLLCEKSRAEVQIMTQKEFVARMEQMNGIMPMLNYIHQVFDLSILPSRQDSMKYLRDMYCLLECCVGSDAKWLVDLKNAIMLNESMEIDALWDTYEKAERTLLSKIPLSQVKYICDRDKIYDIYRKYKESIAYERMENPNITDNGEKHLQRIINKHWQKGIQQDILVIMTEWFNKTEFNYRKYQDSCWCCFEDKTDQEAVNLEQLHNLWMNMDWKKNLIECVLRIEGFFDIKEFEFLGVEAQKFYEIEFKEDKYNFREVVHDLCEQIHIAIKDKLSEYFSNIKNNNFTITFFLDQLSQRDKQWLTICLQKVENKSLTGIIKLVKIIDRVSDEYALLLKELEIKNLRILDTYGLDHVEWGGDAKNALHDIRYRYQEHEKIKTEEIGVLYLKKLDSGWPEELRNVLPCVYDVIPQAPIYCVFSGIDIYYQNNPIQIENIYWKKGNESSCPKAVQYILSDKGEKEIIQHIDCREERKKNYYLVMKNNLLPYCGRKDLVRNEYAYYQNNLKYVQKVLASMLMKEYDSLEIVDLEELKKYIDNASEAFRDILNKIFEKASVRSWHYYHHMTVKANFKRIANDDQDELGYWGVNRQRWDQLFHEAYRSVFSNESEDFINHFESGRDAIESAIFSMEDAFLGSSSDLYRKKLDSKNKFRKLLQDMYLTDTYKHNPFAERADFEHFDQQQKREYLEDVCDFAKGLHENIEYYLMYWDFFKETLFKQLQKDNEIKAENLVDLNLEFANSLHMLEKEFRAIYGENNEGAAEKFRQILNYYFSPKK